MNGYTVECGNAVLSTPRPLTTRFQGTAMATKNCSKCKKTKPVSEFYKRCDRPSGLHYQCAQCFREAHAEWRKTNKQNNRNRAARFRANHPLLVKQRHRDWQKKNAGRINASNAMRHARKLKATPPWVDKSAFEPIYRKARQLGMEVDHIVPLQSAIVCGLHVPWNLQLLSVSENARKKNYHWPDMP
jgi:hypothetical protein